ncbi:hypothetical protein EGW08_018060, partial [Elysia chlorotica]
TCCSPAARPPRKVLIDQPTALHLSASVSGNVHNSGGRSTVCEAEIRMRDSFITAWLITVLVFASPDSNMSSEAAAANSSDCTQPVYSEIVPIILKLPALLEKMNAKLGVMESQIESLKEGMCKTGTDSKTTTSGNLEYSQLEAAMNSSVLGGRMYSTLEDFFFPNSCMRNSRAPYLFKDKYLAIYRSTIPGVNYPILCDMITDGGGWIVIQRRSTGEIDFFRDWLAYKAGFGNLHNDFWLGNDNIHTITSTGKFELRVDIECNGEFRFASYSKVFLKGEEDKYTLHLGAYSGTAGDALTYHENLPFATYENSDHDDECGVFNKGGWWYNSCPRSNLNGGWGAVDDTGLRWNTCTRRESATFSEMKIRRLEG